MKELHLGLKFAFSYFSILPIRFHATDNLSEAKVLGAMLFFLPLVGLVIGIVTLLFFLLMSDSSWFGAVIASVLSMILYGFLHTEAVLDVADALYAAHSGKDAYPIIKEPTVGAMGVLYAVAVVLLKVSAITYLLLHRHAMEFLAILIISRLSLLMLLKIHTFRSSFVTQLKEALTLRYFVSAFLLFIVIGSLITANFWLLLLLGLIVAYGIARMIRTRLGFINGDVLGATLESVEIALLFGVGLFVIT